MTVKVSVTIEVDNRTAGRTVFELGAPWSSGDNPAWTASEVRKALLHVASRADTLLTAEFGDVERPMFTPGYVRPLVAGPVPDEVERHADEAVRRR